jgi:uncharacterized membrane protein YdjX (TVP38/TMEM64 family)
VSDTARAAGKLALLAAGLVAFGLALRGLGVAPGSAFVDTHIRDAGLQGELLLFALGAVLTAVGVPRQGVAFLAGYAFGAAAGAAVALAAQVAGCALAYAWARLVGRAWAERRLAGRLGPRLRPVADALRQNPFEATLALRLFPVGSNLALNLLAGMLALPLAKFLAASALGHLPQTVIFALLGKGVRVDGVWQIALSGVLLAVSVGLGLWLWRRHRAGAAA